MAKVVQITMLGASLYALDSDGQIWLRKWHEVPNPEHYWEKVKGPLPVWITGKDGDNYKGE